MVNLILEAVAKPKAPKIVSFASRKARETVGANLRREIARAFPGKSETYGFEKIETDTGTSLSTLQRIASGAVGCSIDTLANIAHNIGCTLADLTQTKDGLETGSTDPVSQKLHPGGKRPR